MRPQTQAVATMTDATICYSILPIAIYYATPCLTVIWLLILRHPVPNLHHLIAGTIAVIAANLILTLKPIRTTS